MNGQEERQASPNCTEYSAASGRTLMPGDQMGSDGMQASHSQVVIAPNPAALSPTLYFKGAGPRQGGRRSIGPCEERQSIKIQNIRRAADSLSLPWLKLYCNLAIGCWKREPQVRVFRHLACMLLDWLAILRYSSDVSSASCSSNLPYNPPLPLHFQPLLQHTSRLSIYGKTVCFGQRPREHNTTLSYDSRIKRSPNC